ncbi:LOW QUALITY PROTEIN: ras-related protein Rab-37-like isoform X2 [Vespula maculifrons]|uniref:Ras-related protein Rab-37-like isoform X2 n=1 Tax=Vespula maculifrons TaxID=7453 RepID=A0ABD2AZN6_VESMC
MSTVEESVRSVTKRNKLGSRCGTSEPTDWSSSTTPTSDTRDPVQVVPTADTSRFSSASLRTQDPLGPPSRRFDNLDSTARQATPDQVDFFFKVMLLGDSGVGKTCLLTRFRDGRFLFGNYITTVGIDFRNKIITVDETRVKLQIWDTAGQERFRSVTHAYYRDAHGTIAIIIIVLVVSKFISFPLRWSQSKQKIIPSCLSPLSINIARLLSALLLLYDVTNKTSFDNIRAWLSEIREHANEDVVIMLLGNKSDCGQERVVKKEDGERLAQEYKVPFMETSAKTGLNVELAFLAVARELKARKSSDPDDTKFNVQDYVRQQSKRNSCFNSNCLTT